MRAFKQSTTAQTAIDPNHFGWDPCVMAAVRHTTLPWSDGFESIAELNVSPLNEAKQLGEADKLSLLAQCSAHLSFVTFMGMPLPAFEVAEWHFIKKRSEDARLVRSSAKASASPSALATLRAFASLIEAPQLPILDETWARPDAVYQAIDRLLRTGPASSKWRRLAAIGEILPPGPEALRSVVNGSGVTVIADADTIDQHLRDLENLGMRTTSSTLGGAEASPLIRYSALTTKLEIAGDAEAGEVAEQLLPTLGTTRIIVLSRYDRFDARSRNVITQLRKMRPESNWVVSHSLDGFTATVPSHGRLFVVASRLEHAERLRHHLGTAGEFSRLRRFAESDGFTLFLDAGVIDLSIPSLDLTEPKRSCLAALALLGDEFSPSIAQRFLQEVGIDDDLKALTHDGLASFHDDAFRFASTELRMSLVRTLDEKSLGALANIAATTLVSAGHFKAAIQLFLDTGKPDNVLKRVASDARFVADTIKEKLSLLPPRALAPFPALALAAARHLFALGRYEDARELLASVEGDDRPILEARIERRRGNYATALERLTALTTVEAGLLRAELYRLTGRLAEADAELDTVEGEGSASLLRYERAMVALDRGEAMGAIDGDDYYANRQRSYAALREGDWNAAEVRAARASELAPTLPLKIDAELDRLYARFLAGDWDSARVHARSCLALVEETQGDRAAGGVLFTLSYLCSDAAMWHEAQHHIIALERFYRASGDERRERELDLLRAHHSFTRCIFDQAVAFAENVIAGCSNEDIVEAAALIVDEVAWLEGTLQKLRSTGTSSCLELKRRHAVMRARLNDEALDGDDIWSLIRRFEQSGSLPEEASLSDNVKLLRAVEARAKRSDDAQLAAAARLIRSALALPSSAIVPDDHSAGELVLLQGVANARFPLSSSIFASRWKLATRNRLGRWTQHGTAAKSDADELEGIAARGEADWMRLSSDAILFVDGASKWSEATRGAVGALLYDKWQHENARRLIAQERDSAPSPRVMPALGIIAECSSMRDALAQIQLVGPRDLPVVILGESGTGKELMAHAVHRLSTRKNQKFTALNCAALPEQLVESELFGHVKGAFTGADRDRLGLIETTDGGTLFLDEIGELPLAVQAKLLRFLQEGEIRRVGDAVTRTADVRIVAATNRKLEQWVDSGKFREDLYYRVRGVEVKIPPLRDRGSDIMLIAHDFLAREQEKHRGGPDRFSDVVEAVFASYEWPGNVRELQNTIRAAHALGATCRAIDLEHLPEKMRSAVVVRKQSGTYFEEIIRFRRSLLEQSLGAAGGNQNKAAQLLGITRQALAYQIRELGILVRKG